ncbi:MAG: hypothetical protein KDK24_12990 [Pseudooceanicola sp.]|nr:hypothetical protein [Pseudooceanicola sp.]
MTAATFALVLVAALLHAVWNALVKGGADKAAAMMAVVIGQGLFGALALPFAAAPDLASLPYMALGMALHIGYQTFLVAAYRIGDLTQVYPIARGASPLIVTAVSALLLGVSFTSWELAAILLIACGIASMSLARGAAGLVQGKAAGLALVTGGFIAAYSMSDGLGARVAGTALGYYGWVSLLNTFGFGLLARFIRPGLVTAGLRQSKSLVIGGGASFVAYALVVHAFTLAPIALVTALRETSIVFALGIGVLFLGERITPVKIAATLATVAGAILLRLAQL